MTSGGPSGLMRKQLRQEAACSGSECYVMGVSMCCCKNGSLGPLHRLCPGQDIAAGGSHLCKGQGLGKPHTWQGAKVAV